VTVFAREGVSEQEFFDKVMNTLNTNSILPEAVEFKRLTLEQIYLGVNSGQFQSGGAV
jgi:hypothetical protein